LTAKFRELTGRYSEGQLSSADILIALNTYYQGVLPEKLSLETRKGFWQFDTKATDTGLYPYNSSVIVAKPPIYCLSKDMPTAEEQPWTEDEENEIFVDQNQIKVYTEPEDFYGAWPQDQTYARSQPIEGLLWRRNLYIQPPPDDIYTIQVQAEFSIITPLVNPTDEPEQQNWGYAIAYGSAIEFLASKGRNPDGAAALVPMYNFYFGLIERREIRNMMFKRAVPHW